MSGIRCRTCGRQIHGCAQTKFGGAWVHTHNNAERCPAPHRSLASPVTLEELNAKTLRDAERARRRAGVKPR